MTILPGKSARSMFTNAERVDLYKTMFVTTLHKSGWTALPQPAAGRG